MLLKSLRPAAADPERRRRFLEEARLAAGVDHPNVVRVLHVDADDEALVAEWVEGTDLRALLDGSGPLPPALAAFVVREAARGLAAVHAAGILHRDVSAANVLVGHDGAVKLTDFGLASLAPKPGDEVRGTLSTLAPEVVLGDAPTPASDLFSLGAVLAHALTGRPPFEGATTSALLDAVLHADPAAALAADPRVPASVAAVASVLLARDPAARPASAAEAADRLTAVLPDVGVDDLAAYLADPDGYLPPAPVEPPPASGPGSPRAEAPPVGRQWLVPVVGAVVGLALVALGVATRQPAPERPRPSAAEPAATVPLDIASESPFEAAPTSADEAVEDVVLGPETALAAESPPVTRALPETPPLDVPSMPPPSPGPGADRPAAPQTGSLAIVVEPWARVRIDGRDVGTTPFDAVSLAAGDHEVALINPDFPPHTVRVRVEAGEVSRTVVSLWDLVGRVSLEVSPWADVTVDGEPWDTVPPQSRPLVLAPGEHVLGFAHPTLGRRDVRLRVAAGERRTVRVRMAEADG